MTFLKLAAAAMATLIVSLATVDAVQAQTSAEQQARDRASTNDRARVERDLATNNQRRSDRRGRQPSPEQIAQAAQAVATAAGLSCRVKESALLGATTDNHDMYEVACDGGAGYILTSATPPQTFDCLVLSAQADQVRAAGGEVAANSVCNLPGNQNSAVMIAGYAREAGVPCEVDAGKALGATPEGNLVFEVGCAGSDGYHIEKATQGWVRTDCLQIMATNLTCQFTTADEQVAGFRPLLVGTAIDDCAAQQIHLLAQNDTGRFIEVKCASGDGFVARVKDNAVSQIYPCAAAVRIGGGCTLTPVAAPQAAAVARQ